MNPPIAPISQALSIPLSGAQSICQSSGLAGAAAQLPDTATATTLLQTSQASLTTSTLQTSLTSLANNPPIFWSTRAGADLPLSQPHLFSRNNRQSHCTISECHGLLGRINRRLLDFVRTLLYLYFLQFHFSSCITSSQFLANTSRRFILAARLQSWTLFFGRSSSWYGISQLP